MVQPSANMAQFESHEFRLHQQTLGLIFDYYRYYFSVVFLFYYVRFRFTWQIKYIPHEINA